MSVEIHPPSGPIHSLKEFLLHLLTITAGVLIALGLDNVVEWRHHRHLVHQATENLVREIRENREGLGRGITQMDKIQGQLEAILQAVHRLQADRTATPGNLTLDVSFTTLSTTAWGTASGSGAVSYMEYEALGHYTRIYDLQHVFMTVQQRATDSLLELESFGALLQGDRKRISDVQTVDAERAVGRALAATGAAEDIAKALDVEYGRFLTAR